MMTNYSNDLFQMDKESAVGFYKKTTNALKRLYLIKFGKDISVSFDRELFCSEGRTKLFCDPICASIGIRSLTNFVFSKRVSDERFIRPLIAIYHEFAHIEQILNCSVYCHNVSSDDKYVSVSLLSTKNNPNYYRDTDNMNYLHNPFEIKGEQDAIMNAYLYIVRTFPDVPETEIENLFVDYVNELAAKKDKSGKPAYFISGQFSSLEEIDQAFDAAFEASKTYQRSYNFNSPDVICEDYLGNPDYQFVRDAFLDTENAGYGQDKIVANLNLHVHPEFMQDFRILESVKSELSDEALYGRNLDHPKSNTYDRRIAAMLEDPVFADLDEMSERENQDTDDFGFG